MIVLRQIHKRYGERVILNDASFIFPSKGLVSVIGPSGIGKSSLFNLIAGFDHDYDGDITVGRRHLKKMDKDGIANYRQQNIGFVFQSHHLMSSYTVLENILLPTDGSEQYKAYAIELVERMGLSDKLHEPIDHLSGGQKQRVAIARALIHRPNIILADEPTGSLDYDSSQMILDILQELSKSHLVLMITHDEAISARSDVSLKISDGKLVSTDPVIVENLNFTTKPSTPIRPLWIARKNVKNHLSRLFIIAISLALGVVSVVLSLSFSNRLDQDIEAFKEKNHAFNVGYVPYQVGAYEKLEAMEGVSTLFYQYVLEDLTIQYKETALTLSELYPMPVVEEVFSTGRLPMKGKHEIALSIGLANKLSDNVQTLIGDTLQFEGNELIVTGIYNAPYDAVLLSSDIEANLYQGMKKTPYSIYYTVNDFNDVSKVSQTLKELGLEHQSAADSVESLLGTFNSIASTFKMVSFVILIVAIIISGSLLIQLQKVKTREVGLYRALGFKDTNINTIILSEAVWLACLTAIVFIIVTVGSRFFISWEIDTRIVMAALVSIIIFVGLGSYMFSRRAFDLDPAVSLRE